MDTEKIVDKSRREKKEFIILKILINIFIRPFIDSEVEIDYFEDRENVLSGMVL
ncbi:hypothetical protein [Alkalicoccus halolimnae]|uniref:Uncharacterized protein n=1 Tax=Alkalicoccus halolimnae TaxID=1667239 RepID=A0AAJ8LTP8_9BACI|nr:hypothetical protein [Alkalicoccus halolimnae]